MQKQRQTAKCLLNIYYVLSTILDAEDTTVNKTIPALKKQDYLCN